MLKNLNIIAAFFVLLAFSKKTEAQQVVDTVIAKVDSAKKHHKKVVVKTYTNKPSQAFYIEGGGNSIILSANYDRRFTKRLDGLGFRAGIGYFPLQNFNILVLPVGINLLAGKNGHFMEIGLNITPVFPKNNGITLITNLFPEASFGQIDFKDNQSQTLIGLPMGYRYQPAKKALNFRVGVEPMVGKRSDNNAVIIVTGHLSLGYSF